MATRGRKSPRKIEAARMMLEGYSQRDIERITGVSRVTIRTMAKHYGFQFARNGIEKRGVLCICSTCKDYFYRNPSRVDRADKSYCSMLCKRFSQYGEGNANWKEGSSIKSWSSWVVGQAWYKEWREEVLKRANYRCMISGDSENLEAHHIKEKAADASPELAFDVKNGICLSKKVHTHLHSLHSRGFGPEEAWLKTWNDFAVEREMRINEILENDNMGSEALDDLDGLN